MKVRALLITLVLCFTFGTATGGIARDCKKDKPCGDSCIPKNDVCPKEGGAGEATEVHGAAAPADFPASIEAPAQSSEEKTGENIATTGKVKICKTGKPCGDSCIAQKASCHAGE